MPGNQFQREIKRSGYLKGTSMKRVRNKFLGVIFAFTFASYGISYYFTDFDKIRKRIESEDQWKLERQQRITEMVELRQQIQKEYDDAAGMDQ